MFKNNLIMTVIILIWLFLCSFQDIRKKKIHIILIGAGCLCILLYSFVLADVSIISRLAGLSLGIFMLLINLITRGQIGAGDGLIVSIMGMGLGFSQMAFILANSLFGSAVFAIGLIIFRKAGRKRAIPFIPFLLIGYIGGLLC